MKITALEKKFNQLSSGITLANKNESINNLKSFSKEVGSINGTGKFKSSVSKLIRELKKKKPKVDKVNKLIENSITEITSLNTWVLTTKPTIQVPLEKFIDQINTTIGARSVGKFTKEAALYIAACDAGHRDMSLSF
jgi:hypothetical protein